MPDTKDAADDEKPKLEGLLSLIRSPAHVQPAPVQPAPQEAKSMAATAHTSQRSLEQQRARADKLKEEKLHILDSFGQAELGSLIRQSSTTTPTFLFFSLCRLEQHA